MSLNQEQLDEKIDIVAQHTPTTLRRLSLKQLQDLAAGWLVGYEHQSKSVIVARLEISTQKALKHRLNNTHGLLREKALFSKTEAKTRRKNY